MCMSGLIVLYRAHPLLADCGGFEMLLTKPKMRTELQVDRCGSCSTELRCTGTGRIYIQPIQKSLIVSEGENDTDQEYEECLFCHKLFPIHKIRLHITSCTVNLILQNI